MADYAKYEPILEMAKAAGFSRAEVFVCTSEAFSVSAHKGKAEDLRVERRSGVALRGLLGSQMGYAATEAEGEAAYAELVRAAAAIWTASRAMTTGSRSSNFREKR